MYRQPSISLKTVSALRDLYKSFKSTPQPKLFMTLLVKNEADILEENILFHKSMGVDGFIITDNNSTDNTPMIIEKYKRMGWVREVIIEPGNDYLQKQWVDRMVWIAKTKYKADWVINADADEFWYATSGSIKDELSTTRSNALMCRSINVYPEDGKPFYEWDKVVYPVEDVSEFDLSPYSIFSKQRGKVMHRTDGYLQISMGNHKVSMFPRRKDNAELYIYHYSIKGRQQFISKMVNGGQQLENHPKKRRGRHWRYFYELYKQGLLDKEYDRVIGKNRFDELSEKGFIKTDKTMVSLLKEIRSSL